MNMPRCSRLSAVVSSASGAVWMSAVIVGAVYFASALFSDGSLFDALAYLGLYLSYVGVPGLLTGLLAGAKTVRAFTGRGPLQKFVGYIGALAIWLILILIAEFVVNMVRDQGTEWWLFDFLVWSLSATVVFTAVAAVVEIVALIRCERPWLRAGSFASDQSRETPPGLRGNVGS